MTAVRGASPSTSLRGALATKQSILSSCSGMDCFAARNDVEKVTVLFSRFQPSSGSTLVTDHVDDEPVGVPDEKSPDAPWLVGQGIHDRTALLSRGRVTDVAVADFDTDIRVRFIPAVGGHDVDLGRRVGRRGEGDDPAHVHGGLEPEHPFLATL